MKEEQKLAPEELSDIAAAFDTLKDEHKRLEVEVKKYGQANTETVANMEKLHEAIEAVEEKAKEKISALETKLNRPAMDPDKERKENADLATKAFDRFVRGKSETMDWGTWVESKGTEVERKALQTDTLTEGGLFVPGNRDDTLIPYLREIDDVWNIARIMTIGLGDYIEFPMENSDSLTVTDTTERGSRAETGTPGFALKRIYVHETYADPGVTQKMLDDSNFDVVSWLNMRANERFVQKFGANFITGTGEGQPWGLKTRFTGGVIGSSYVPSGHATEIPNWDCLIQLVDDMHPRYSRNGSWLMKRQTKRVIRQLKDGVGQYYWERSVQAGQPNLILDHPVYEAPTMDGPTVKTFSGNVPAAFFGDFNQGYCIVRKAVNGVLRDPYTNKPYIMFYYTYRCGGDVLDANAINVLKIAAS